MNHKTCTKSRQYNADKRHNRRDGLKIKGVKDETWLKYIMNIFLKFLYFIL